MDDDYFTNNIQLNTNLINIVNGEVNENAIVKSNNQILLRAVEEHMQNTSQYFNNELLSDVIININNNTKRLYAHKFILCKSSDVFYTMLMKKNWLNQNHKRKKSSINQDGHDQEFDSSNVNIEIDEITLIETDECLKVFEKFLKFFYTAEIIIASEEVIGLLLLADKYNINTLRNLTSQYMMIKAKSPFVKNAVDWYSYAKIFKLNDLKEVCMKTIAWNTSHVLDSDEWLNVDLEFIKDLLVDSDLVVPNEMILFKSISKWLLSEQHIENFEKNCKELISLIRFSQMLENELFEVENSDLAKNNFCFNLIKEQLHKAYRFRVLEEIIVKQYNNSFNRNNELFDIWYLPREYTELTVVDRVEIKNTLRVGIQVDVKTYRGPAPKNNKLADWKVLYRTFGGDYDRWMLRVSCNQSAIIESNNYCKAQVTAIVYNNENTVLQVESGPTFAFNTQNYYDLDINLCYPNESKELVVLIKPVLF